jgi:hypothetical protein
VVDHTQEVEIAIFKPGNHEPGKRDWYVPKRSLKRPGWLDDDDYWSPPSTEVWGYLSPRQVHRFACAIANMPGA